MKTVLVIVAIVMGLALTTPLMAQSQTDYSKMSTDQLYQLKQDPNHQHDMNLEDVWMKRVANMSPEELKKYKVEYSYQEIQQMRERRASPRPSN